jgi:hypothetical protein
LHVQPTWPFAVRFSDAAFGDPDLRAKLAPALGTIACGPGEGTEFLLDASGTLRAVWSPGGKPDWHDADVLQREIAAIRLKPAAIRTTGSHLHAR